MSANRPSMSKLTEDPPRRPTIPDWTNESPVHTRQLAPLNTGTGGGRDVQHPLPDIFGKFTNLPSLDFDDTSVSKSALQLNGNPTQASCVKTGGNQGSADEAESYNHC